MVDKKKQVELLGTALQALTELHTQAVEETKPPESDSAKTIRILNEEFKKRFGYLEQELNRWCIQTNQPYPRDGKVETITLDLTGPIGVTKCSPTEDAFSLNVPIAGHIKTDSILVDKCEDILVFRYLLGYTAARKFALEGQGDPFPAMVYTLLHYLKTLKGYGPETLTTGRVYGSFTRPGQPDLYFRELENYAAYELRLYSNCNKVEVKA